MPHTPPTLEDVLLELVDPGFNFRSDLKLTPEMRESVRVEGVRIPPSLTRLPQGRYRTIGGHRRIQAAKEAGHKSILAFVHGGMPEAEEKGLGLLDNLAREDITPYDTFMGIVALDELGMKGKDIAPKTGISPAMVSQYRSLTKLYPEAMAAFKEGNLPVTKAFQVAASPDQAATLALFLKGETREEVGRKTRRVSSAPVVRASKIKVPLVSGATVTVAGADVSLEEAIEAMAEAVKLAKVALSKGISAKTAAAYWKDVAAAG